MASHGLPLPPILADCFTEEGWALLDEEEQRQSIEIMNQKDVITKEGRRISRMIMSNQDCSRKLIDIANRYHWEKETKQREWCRKEGERQRAEALLRKSEREQRQRNALLAPARSVKCEDDGGCSASVGEDEAGSRRQRPAPDAGAGAQPAADSPPSP